MACKNLTLQEMALTAIALKRYELRQGRMPTKLQDLTPEFLDRLPLDLMTGQPLHYRLRADGLWTLYSVGADGVDDGGDAGPRQNFIRNFPLQSEADLVWPHALRDQETAPALAARILENDRVESVIQLDHTPLSEALVRLSRQAGLEIQFAPEPARKRGRSSAFQQPVSVRFEHVRARDAFECVLSEYRLVKAPAPNRTNTFRIIPL